MQRPDASEYAPYFQLYLDRVPAGDVTRLLRDQGQRTELLVRGLEEARGRFAYAPGKWTVKRVVQHVIDGERIFGYRALCLARGESVSLPGFDENAYAALDGSDVRSLASLADEYASVRRATLTLFGGFDAAAWSRRGIANQQPISVRALCWLCAGHELHHLAVLHERYGVG